MNSLHARHTKARAITCHGRPRASGTPNWHAKAPSKFSSVDRMVAMFEEMFRTGSAINTTKLKGGMQVRNLGR